MQTLNATTAVTAAVTATDETHQAQSSVSRSSHEKSPNGSQTSSSAGGNLENSLAGSRQAQPPRTLNLRTTSSESRQASGPVPGTVGLPAGMVVNPYNSELPVKNGPDSANTPSRLINGGSQSPTTMAAAMMQLYLGQYPNTNPAATAAAYGSYQPSFNLNTTRPQAPQSGMRSFSGGRRRDDEGSRVRREPLNYEDLSKSNLYIKGLEGSTTDADLYSLCQEYGAIVSTKAVLDPDTNQCKGYGFVDFETQDAARTAHKQLQQKGFQVQFAKKQQTDLTNVYFANLPLHLTDSDLEEMCKEHGTVISTRILKGTRGVSRGIGFARMETQEQCKKLVDTFNGKTVPGTTSTNPLIVKFADAAKSKPRETRILSQFNSMAPLAPMAGPMAAPMGAPMAGQPAIGPAADDKLANGGISQATVHFQQQLMQMNNPAAAAAVQASANDAAAMQQMVAAYQHAYQQQTGPLDKLMNQAATTSGQDFTSQVNTTNAAYYDSQTAQNTNPLTAALLYQQSQRGYMANPYAALQGQQAAAYLPLQAAYYATAAPQLLGIAQAQQAAATNAAAAGALGPSTQDLGGMYMLAAQQVAQQVQHQQPAAAAAATAVTGAGPPTTMAGVPEATANAMDERLLQSNAVINE